MIIKVKLEKGAKMPKRSHETDAGYDLFANKFMRILPYSVGVAGTGVHMAIPEGWFGDIRPRSSWFSAGKDVSGIIDSGYTGEIKVMIHNNSDSQVTIKEGDKIAQMIISQCPKFAFQEVEELEETERGNGGFGSTGR